jgi:hypothetical protein
MASLHNFPKNKHPGFFHGIGDKIKFGAEIAGAVKTIFDVGKGIYSAVSTVAPIASALI